MKTLRQMEIEEDLRTRHTGLMTVGQVGKELGIKKRAYIIAFMDGVPVYPLNGRRRWRIADVAKRLADLEVIE